MRTLTTKVFTILALIFIVSLKPAYGQEVKVPDVHDGSWILIGTGNHRVPVVISPTVEYVFTIGTTRMYQQIGNPTQVTEVMSLQNPSQPVLTIWNEGKNVYYALLIDKEWKIGNQISNIVVTNFCAGSWTAAHVSVAPAGPVTRWWTLEFTNPDNVPPAGKMPLAPAPLTPGPLVSPTRPRST